MGGYHQTKRDDLDKGQLVWVEPMVGDMTATARHIQREGNLWVIDSFVFARDANKRLTRTRTAWVWCKSLTSGRLHDFHETELTLHQPTPNEEGVTDQ